MHGVDLGFGGRGADCCSGSLKCRDSRDAKITPNTRFRMNINHASRILIMI